MPRTPNAPGDYARVRDQRRTWGDLEEAGDTAPALPPVIPKAGDWGRLASQLWEALGTSGQSVHFQSTDYAQAWLICESADRADRGGTLHRGTTLESLLKGLGSLGYSEVERRKARIALTRPVEKPEPVGLRVIREEIEREAFA